MCVIQHRNESGGGACRPEREKYGQERGSYRVRYIDVDPKRERGEAPLGRARRHRLLRVNDAWIIDEKDGASTALPPPPTCHRRHFHPLARSPNRKMTSSIHQLFSLFFSSWGTHTAALQPLPFSLVHYVTFISIAWSILFIYIHLWLCLFFQCDSVETPDTAVVIKKFYKIPRQTNSDQFPPSIGSGEHRYTVRYTVYYAMDSKVVDRERERDCTFKRIFIDKLCIKKVEERKKKSRIPWLWCRRHFDQT